MTRRRRVSAGLVALLIAASPAVAGCSGEADTRAPSDAGSSQPRPSDAGSKEAAAREDFSGLPFVNTVKGVNDSADNGQWRRIFSDDFNGDELNQANWRTRVQPRFGRRLCASPDPAMVRVSDGRAVLGIKQVGQKTKTCPQGVFANAMIGTGEVTEPGFQATYGLFAARVRYQSGRGQHASFWMQGAGDGAAEIDISEYFGDGRPDGGISNFVHLTEPDGTVSTIGGIRPKVSSILGEGNTPSNGWHVWSVEWSKNEYIFRVDGSVTFRTKRSVASGKEFLVLSLLTSDYELPALNTTKSTMKVDWVRAWQEK